MMTEEMLVQDDWYKNISYKDAKVILTEKLQNMSKNLVATGYYMKYIRDNELYKEDGYTSIWEFAEETYGIKRTTASRWMAINDKFSKDGNSPILDEPYREYNRSQLQELLYLDDKQMEEVTPDMTVKEIREIRKPEVIETEDEEELLCDECTNASSLTGNVDLCANCGHEGNNFEELKLKERPGKKCITGISKSGICGAAAYCSEPVECCAECNDACNGRCGWLPEKEKCATSHTDDELPGQMHIEKDFKEFCPDPIESIEEDDIPLEEPEQEDECDVVKSAVVDEEPVVAQSVESEVVSEVDETIELAKLELLKEQSYLDLMLKEYGQDGRLTKKEKVRVAALAGFICDLELVKLQNVVQPELPQLKNNDQRKEWLRNYRDWGLWYEDKNIGCRYYKYDFDNGARLIVETYTSKAEEWIPSFESSYFHLIGGPTPPKGKYGVTPWSRYSSYSKHPNSETELVEFLKYVQKEGK